MFCFKKLFLLIFLHQVFCGFIAYSLPQSNVESNPWLPQKFVHPGLLQTREDLNFVRLKIMDKDPAFLLAFENLQKAASLDFVPQPFTHVVRGSYGREGQGHRELSASAQAAHHHALLWYITKEKAHAEKAIEIINAWSEKLWDFDGNDAKLIAALTGQYFLNAAEILRYTDTGWEEEDIAAFSRLMLTVFYPVMEDFFAEANGNWDAAMINTLLGIGIFTDRPDIFKKAVDRFYWGPTNGGITKYIYPNGQIQESIRDWPHVQLGLGEFAKAAQVAWTQGVDFYGVADERLALGMEYTAKFMLGEDVPVYGPISLRGRGNLRDIYESVYSHYKSQRGTPMPYTERAIAVTRSTSGLAFLTSQRAESMVASKDPNKTAPLSQARKLTGAGFSPAHNQPTDALLVKPGESIQHALDRAAGNQSWVLLQKGVHILHQTLELPNGVTLAGEGLESILWLEGSLATLTIKAKDKDASDITIRDMLIEGATATDPGTDPNQGRRTRARMSAPAREGIVFSGDKIGDIKRIRFENLTVQNFTKHGVSLRGALEVAIVNCDFSDNGSNVVPGAGLHHNLHLIRVRNAVIENSRFSTSPWGSGLHLSHCDQVIIRQNEFSRNKKHGIQVAESGWIRLVDNLSEGNDGHGIAVESWMEGIASGEIKNNLSRNNGEAGIHIENPDRIPMDPNLLIDNRIPAGGIQAALTAKEIAMVLGQLNLDHPGLAGVKNAGQNTALAARELLAYFRRRTSVIHPVALQLEGGYDQGTDADFKLADHALRHVMRGQPAYPLFDVGKDIDWSSRPVPDNEWVWQLNRMSFWTAMSKSYSQSKNQQYAWSWAHQMTDWVRKNPRDEQHAHAWRSIEAGIRGHAWTGHFYHFLPSPHFTPEVLLTFLKSCHDHAEFLMTTYKTGSNWALMEAEGMAFIAMTFPEFREAGDWLHEATERLNAEINLQVYPDGHQRELAFGYHAGSIGWFLRTFEMAKLNGKENLFSDNYLDLIEKMCEVPMKLAFPNGTTPQFGDAWTGKPGQYYESLKKWNELFGRPDFLYVATEGKQGTSPTETAFAFPQSGLYAMRSSWQPEAISLILKCGPDGGGHSHPDNATFELYAGGRSLMPDSGSFIYSGDPEGRAWFRQTRVHQTLTLDDKDAAYAPKLLLWEPGDEMDKLVVENQSYPDLAHRRAVLFVDKSYFILIDEAIGKATGILDLNFQLAPGPSLLDAATLTAQTQFDEGYNVMIQTQPQLGIKMVEAEGQVSFIYTQKEPRPAFSYKVEKKGRSNGYRFVTVVAPYKNNPPQITVKLMGKPKIGANSFDLEITENGKVRRERLEWK